MKKIKNPVTNLRKSYSLTAEIAIALKQVKEIHEKKIRGFTLKDI
jgi:hypothetical protein